MVNLTLPTLPNRPGLGEILSSETVPTPNVPSAQTKAAPKFEDHLAQAEIQTKTAQTPTKAKVTERDNPATPKRKATEAKPDVRTDGKVREAKSNPAHNEALELSQKAQIRPNRPARIADHEAPSTPKEPMTTASSRADEASSTSIDRPNTAAKRAKVAGLDEEPSPDQTQTDNKALDSKSSVLVIQADDVPAGEQDTLASIALDLSKDAGEPWEKRLQDMLAFMGIQPNTLPQELPSLAILTGQLQFVEPESIPSTLAQSPMLGNVMASADPDAIIEEVKPLGAWLDDMGWSPAGLIVKDPIAFQDLMNTPVSLKDLMKTFQVDPDRIVVEAKLLQDTLPLEGASPYIARAAKMQADPTLPQPAPKKAALEKPIQDNPMDAEFLSVILNSPARHANTVNEPAPNAPEATASIPKAEPRVPLSSIDQMLTALASPSANPAMDGMPKAMLSAQNPFQAIEMRSSETFSFDPDSGIEDSPIVSRPERRDWLENIQAFHLQSDSVATASTDKARAFDPSILLERLSEATLTAADDFKGSDSEQGEGSLPEATDETAPNFAAPTQQKAGATFQVATTEIAKAHAPHILQKEVFDNASMLVKDGGGAMRIDIGNKELGAIDLAVEVKDNKVAIKIVAASPQAREMLATELPRLKESLQSQDLSLSKVEIGLSGGSSWTSSDGRSSQRESSSQTEEIFGVSGSGRKSSRSYRQVSSTQNLQPQVIHDGGSIKVRV